MSASTDAFRALRINKTDQGTEHRLETVSLDELQAGEVIVRVCWSGINYKDALAVSGKGRIMRAFPRVAGIDLAGVVESSAAPAYQAGDKVLVTGCNIGEVLDGGFAEFARLPTEAVVPLPQGLSLREAMIIGTAGFTAAFALRRMLENHQQPDMGPIAVTGPTGGVGSIAIDLFKRAGFEVAAITGKADSAGDYLRSLGADEVIARQDLDLGKRPLESARWGGAVDNIGGETLTWLTRTVGPWGNIASIGLAQSHELNSTVMPLILRGVSLLGIHSVECPRSWREAIWQKLAGDWRPQHLEQIVAREVDLDGIAEAADDLIAGRLTGRSLVKVSEE